MHRLGAISCPPLPPKARMLSEAAALGLPVPDGVVVGMTWDSAFETEYAALLRDGPLIVRAALDGEDGPERSAAGLGLSVPDCTSIAALERAFEQARACRREPWLLQYRGFEAGATDCLIVQRQIERDQLVVGALLPSGVDYIEVHAERGEVLARGDTPDFAGCAERWHHEHAAAVRALLDEVRTLVPLPRHGLDIEVVLDPNGRANLVQVRPLTHDLVEQGQRFLAAVRAAGQEHRLGGQQVLDAEHNPAPLSPAHASLIEWLATQRPKTGGLTTLAGWLYTKTMVRDLPGTPSPTTMGPVEALHRLRDRELPAARTRLHNVRASPHLDAGLDAFLAMIDVYLGVLLPVRAAAGSAIATAAGSPFSLRDRAEHADVLPAAWDVAAPPLGSLATFETTSQNVPLPDDPSAAAVLLTEWDDHLFALGLAAVREPYLAAGRALGLGTTVFGLDLEQLRRATIDPTFDARAHANENLARTRTWGTLRPPLVLDDGRPLPGLPHRLLHGVAIGGGFAGPVAQRAGLEALLENPPRPGSIVVLPALTAQAALALQRLDIEAVCCEHGGAMSHAALMLRELGIHGLVGCSGCTRIPDGTPATIDPHTGRLQIASSVTLGS